MPIGLGSAESGIALVCLRCNHSWLRRCLAKLPGTCPRCCSPYWNRPRKGEPVSQAQLTTSSRATVPGSRPLTEAEGLQAAAKIIHGLHGYRKAPDYRMIQNDLHYICEVLQRVSSGETDNITRPTEW
jgi:hypothetical protein